MGAAHFPNVSLPLGTSRFQSLAPNVVGPSFSKKINLRENLIYTAVTKNVPTRKP